MKRASRSGLITSRLPISCPSRSSCFCRASFKPPPLRLGERTEERPPIAGPARRVAERLAEVPDQLVVAKDRFGRGRPTVQFVSAHACSCLVCSVARSVLL